MLSDMINRQKNIDNLRYMSVVSYPKLVDKARNELHEKTKRAAYPELHEAQVQRQLDGRR